MAVAPSRLAVLPDLGSTRNGCPHLSGTVTQAVSPPRPSRFLDDIDNAFCFHIRCDPPAENVSGTEVDDKPNLVTPAYVGKNLRSVTHDWLGVDAVTFL